MPFSVTYGCLSSFALPEFCYMAFEQPRKQPRKLAPEELYQYAVRLLGTRDYSKAEMKTKLQGRAAEPGAVEGAMTRLEEFSFVDDRRFASTFAQYRKESGGFGKARVLRDLAVKQVPDAVAKEMAEKAYEGTDEGQLVTDFLARKFRGKDLKVFLAEAKNLQSAYRRLRTAGFSSNVAIKVLKRFAAGAEGLEYLETTEDTSGGEFPGD